MDDEFLELFERLSVLETKVENMEKQSQRGISTLQFVALLCASLFGAILQAAVHWLKP